RMQRRAAPFTYGVIAVCVALFALAFLLPDVRVLLYGGGNRAGLLPQYNALVARGQDWRIVTAAFLHSQGFLMHILFNMWALSIFGPPLERDVGSVPFAAMYLSGAAAGGAVYFLLGPPMGVAVGASGAIFALFGAWLAVS